MVRSLNNFNIRLAYDTIYLITYKGLPYGLYIYVSCYEQTKA
nr:MAG TPA: hypothetical protein [Caudoviricetes sp.]